MSHVRGQDTKPELLIRRLLWSKGFRGFRLFPKLPGKPDIVFERAKVAVFVDGCFWHGCPQCYSRPKANRIFWDRKLKENLLRDKRVDELLTKLGWKVLRYWEHDIEKNSETIVADIGALVASRRKKLPDLN